MFWRHPEWLNVPLHGYLSAAGKEDLNMVYVNMEMPEEMEPFAMPPGKEGQLKRNAMILKW